jgi:hypothetical protein
MTGDIRAWKIRLFLILAIGGGIGQLLQSLLFGALFGLAGGGDSALVASLTSSALFAVLGFFFEALPVTFFGRPKTSASTALTQNWRSGYLLAWLAMALTSAMLLVGLHVLMSKSIALSPRWASMGIGLIATAASSYAFIFVLNLRFAQNAWPADWQLPAWILLGGQAVLNMAVSFAYGPFSGLLALSVIGIVSQFASAALMAFVLGIWRDGIERNATPSGGLVF